MVGITRLSSANQAGLRGNISDVVPVTHAARLRQHQNALVDHRGPLQFFRPAWLRVVRRRRLFGFHRFHKRCQSCAEGLFDTLGICCGQAVLAFDVAECPERSVISRSNTLDLAEKPIEKTSACIIPAIRRLPGLLHFYAGVSPKGSIVQVSVWDTDEHASQLDRLKEMVADGRRDMEAVGVTFTPIFNYPIDWTWTA